MSFATPFNQFGSKAAIMLALTMRRVASKLPPTSAFQGRREHQHVKHSFTFVLRGKRCDTDIVAGLGDGCARNARHHPSLGKSNGDGPTFAALHP